jgi:hypothetical protein
MKAVLLLLALVSGPAFASGFLSLTEAKLIPHEEASGILVMEYERFVNNSQTPALILAHGELQERPFVVVKRKGQLAFLFADVKGDYCTSSCWDDAVGKAASGILDGAAKGGTAGAALGGGIGWWVGGPPGALGGAAMGGTAGVLVGGGLGGLAGGIDGYNVCQEKLATHCEGTGETQPTKPD